MSVFVVDVDVVAADDDDVDGGDDDDGGGGGGGGDGGVTARKTCLCSRRSIGYLFAIIKSQQ